ncbi:MAG: UDP-glucose/GDP-mannose dehydrogenase family protein [Calditrichaeota bacterium]|nr:UDP-glucose/GDP-mannose dehydrogenase family protein [Calditrichota bacterium]HQU70975.1 UDP-glucose/GDP-mannose dehydrogenase family protein [Calditrichia bacterium]
MRLSIIGVGYVGLVAGACFSESGNHVICMDKNARRIKDLKEGIIPIYEPGLDLLVRRNQSNGRLKFVTDIQEAVHRADVIFIAVGTPPEEDGSADLSHVLSVAREIGKVMDKPKIIVNKSTVPVGTSEKVREVIAAETEHTFEVVSNPEFLKEGAAIDDFMYPDRVIIGTRNNEVAEVMRELYSPFVRTGNPIIVMDERSAEVTKYAANAILATKISFMNEMANLCDYIGADIEMVRKGIGSDKRIGYSFIFPGVGYGGSCFPKDVKAIIRTAAEHQYELEVLKAVDLVNDRQKSILIPKIKSHFGEELKGKRLAMWGLSFKPKTDDMREAPALQIIRDLRDLGVEIHAHDPVAMDEARNLGIDQHVTLFDDYYDAVRDCDGLILVTEWLNYREPDFEMIRSLLREPVVFDGRNIFQPHKLKELGFTYYGVGRR